MSAEPPDPPPEPGVTEDRIARARSRRAAIADADDIAPKLPRGYGFKISKGHLFKIGLTTVLLVMLIVIRQPCADSVSKFVTSFDEGSGSAEKAKMPKPGTVDGSGGQPRYEVINGNMTEAELKAAIERAKQRNAPATPESGSANAGSGSANAGSGSGADSGSAR